MSKVYENGIIRDATSDEESMISQNGGGQSEYYNLVDSFNISEPIESKSFNLDNYDDLLVVLTGIKGTDNKALNIQFTTTKNGNNSALTTNFLSSTTGKNLFVEWLRLSVKAYKRTFGGANNNSVNIVSYGASNSIEDKINKVTVKPTESGCYINEGLIEIYAKNKV